jgi:hypothetical protein
VCNLKKIVLALMALVSSHAYAGFMGAECVGDTVSLPCEKNFWDIAGYALYMQPTTGAHGLVGHYNNSNQSILGVGADPKWGFGFQLEGATHYGSGNDLKLSWYHFRSRNKENLTTPLNYQNIVMAVPSSTNPTYYDSFTANSAYFNISPQWDQVNIELGKLIELGPRDSVHFHGGLNYSRVANSGNSSFVGSTSLNNTFNSYNNSEFSNAVYNGFGIRTGMDLHHYWSWGLAVYAKGSASLLAGTNQSSYQFIDTINAKAYSGQTSLRRTALVPELDGKLGMSYTYEMTQGDMSIEAGWMWANYFSALTIAQNNFGIQGAYFGLKWSDDWV